LPAANNAPGFGKRWASTSPYRNWPTARPRLIPCAAATSAATCSQPVDTPLRPLVGALLGEAAVIQLGERGELARNDCRLQPYRVRHGLDQPGIVEFPQVLKIRQLRIEHGFDFKWAVRHRCRPDQPGVDELRSVDNASMIAMPRFWVCGVRKRKTRWRADR
jgi:hypothetical protein